MTRLFEHAFGVRYDLPIPLWMFVLGGALVVVVSFLLVEGRVMAGRELRGVEDRPVISPLRSWRWVTGLLSVLFLAFLIWCGWIGSQEVSENILPVWFWLMVWIAIPLSCGVLGDWTNAMTAAHSMPWGVIGAALLVFPALALGLSGFETGVVVMPLVKGDPDDDPQQPAGRIRNARKLLTTAALVMSVLLISSSMVTTLLIPAWRSSQAVRPTGGLWRTWRTSGLARPSGPSTTFRPSASCGSPGRAPWRGC